MLTTRSLPQPLTANGDERTLRNYIDAARLQRSAREVL
jgi:hypothetical protein